MKKILLLLCLGFCRLAFAQAPTQFISSPNWVQAKNYYLLTLFEQDKVVNQLLKNDSELSRLTERKREDLNNSVTECKDAACFTDRVKFTPDEIKQISAKLTTLCKPGSSLELLVKNKLIPSYTYSLYKTTNPAELLVKAWEQDAAGINYTIEVYGEGKKPNYPLIDSISFNTKARRYAKLLYDVNATLAGEVKTTRLFFEPAMQAALLYLQINERQDPANYEPMGQTVNKPAVDQVKITDWKKYPYTVILIPGAGPDEPSVALSAEGMLRCRLAAQEYRDGKAPFIMPSGGKVHPYKTKYCEAEEMKTYLIKVLHIPDRAIILEPHARHTTTNMRNGVRLIYRYGIPATRPALVITDKSQTNGILMMAARCEKELKYVPYKLGKHVSETEVEFFAVPDAMQINPYEPLDP
ncbi:YdcF family protein [Mucilaginibacter sp. UR6-11]|uniref:YdcF family protein n=1 Tax=Mucilaginibacter sp. UR6-11 TaxID=1435644 RepID=UPI001E55D8E3|nr:YdcF family protein [Mucilaginibacter sp. UR6-11]MCC8424716.1 YdcF family protein [Mucilaginibacter sp. UR6-11]